MRKLIHRNLNLSKVISVSRLILSAFNGMLFFPRNERVIGEKILVV